MFCSNKFGDVSTDEVTDFSDSDHPMVGVSLTSKEPLPLLGGRPKQSTDASFKQNDYIKQNDYVKQDGYTPYLSYDYLPSEGKFKVRVSLNYSKKKRGIRTKEDFQNIHELAECVKTHGITRRNLASLLMGTCHDPLGVVDPYANNLKIIHRRVCRTQPVPNWDATLSAWNLKGVQFFPMLKKLCSYFIWMPPQQI